MARARNIKPSIYTNEELAELPVEARFLFIGLWTMADREGRLEDRPKRIKMTIFPADDLDVVPLLDGLSDAGLIVRYQVEGNAYIWIPGFAKHQKPHPREAPSTIPPYLGNAEATPRHDQGMTKDTASPAESLFSESPFSDCSSPKRDTGGKPPPSEPDEFIELRKIYPKRSGDQRWKKALQHCRARLKEGHAWDEILAGARRYAAWCEATGKVGTETVKQAATFVGTEKGFLEPWTPPKRQLSPIERLLKGEGDDRVVN